MLQSWVQSWYLMLKSCTTSDFHGSILMLLASIMLNHQIPTPKSCEIPKFGGKTSSLKVYIPIVLASATVKDFGKSETIREKQFQWLICSCSLCDGHLNGSTSTKLPLFAISFSAWKQFPYSPWLLIIPSKLGTIDGTSVKMIIDVYSGADGSHPDLWIEKNISGVNEDLP